MGSGLFPRVGRRRARRSGAIRLRWLLWRTGNFPAVELVADFVVAAAVAVAAGQMARIVESRSGAEFRNLLVPVAAVAPVEVGKK